MTSSLFTPALLGQLDKLSRFFVWDRKVLCKDIFQALQGADANYCSLVEEHQNMQRLLEQSRIKQQQDQEQAKFRVDTLLARHSKLVQEHQRVNTKHQSLEETYTVLADEFQELQKSYGDTWTRFQLISQLLAAHPRDNAGLARFRELLVKDYMAFAERESSLAAEAKALTLLQSIEQELSLLVDSSDIRERTLVGIIGGFSSGKSEFINSFICDPDIRLAVGVQPVTVIPSYVIATSNRAVRGYSINGGHIDIDVDFYKNISHAFISSLDFDLKRLMPFMCVGVQMTPDLFDNICFVDTPGYNPAPTAAEHSQGDRSTAIQFAQQTDALLWLIGLDSNGTVPDSDLGFIQQIGVEGRPVYVVLTKADLRAVGDIDSVLDDVQDILGGEGMQICGISAYSSINREEMAYRHMPLMEFFSKINCRRDSQQSLLHRLDEVFSMYDEAIQDDISVLDSQKKAINGLKLDCLELGGEKILNKMQRKIDNLKNNLNSDPLNDLLKESQRLRCAFRDAIQQAVDSME